ncbi:hypothetical protein G5C66_07855 [Nocardioides sp. KC13]|uniref:Phage major capsid protein n=1 Tax=Nocardioides turkmenicus TaxID=2711220 RepID=A0A6M1QY93_9ACTN|nr:hypothetical protein [Nocardioides sp. KC13]NGN92650.1 hypothetical protein [Nocardioides sp. KC13]
MPDTYTFAASGEQFSVDTESRTIEGLIVPFGVNPIDGRAVTFAAGDIGWSSYKSVKLNLDHDRSTSFGFGLSLAETDAGILGKFKVADGPRGDEALALAESGVYDGLSVNLYRPEGKEKFHLTHVALTAEPAFDEARVSKIAASAASNQEGAHVMGDTTETAEAPQDFSAVTTAITEGFASLNVPSREVVPAGAQTSVKEAPLYTFGARNPGQKEFSADIFAAAKGDHEAHARLDKFIAEQFAPVDSPDVNEVNPTGYRPDLYVDYIEKAAPVYKALYAGGLNDATPFVVPKFSSSTDMVADHVEGQEPAVEGTFVTTGQTVTPGAVSGEYSVTREVIDAGGNPQVSGLIWRQAQRLYVEAMETKAAALLNGAVLAELGTLIPAGDADIVGKYQANLNSAVFEDGSEFWGDVLSHRDAFTTLANAKDGQDRPLFPMINPSNANGTTSARARSLTVAGYNHIPAKTLGATGVNMKSYVGDFAYAPFWASAPLQITLAPTVAKGLSVGLFGYTAGAILDANRIRKITVDITV